MKTKLIIMCLFIGLTGCKVKDGSAPSETTTPTTTPTPSVPATDPITGGTKEDELNALTARFKSDYSANWSNITIGFKPSTYMNSGGGGGTTTVGVCEVYSDGSKKVWMNEDWWTNSSTTAISKKVLYYHEMGHCYFNRAHDTRTYAGGRPYSMMYPILDPVVAYYNSFTSYYISELANSSLGGTMVAFSKMDSSQNPEEVTLIHESRTDEDGVCN